MTLDLSKLRAIAEANSQPGPYSVITNDAAKGNDGHSIVLDANGMWVADCGIAPDAAAHVAAFDPSTALALLDEVERARELLAKCERKLGYLLRDYPGENARGALDAADALRAAMPTNEDRNTLAWLRGYAEEMLLASTSPDAKRALSALDRLTRGGQ